MPSSFSSTEIADRVNISEQLFRYCYFFDSNNTQGLRSLFTDDAVVDYGPEVPSLVGIENIMASISKGLTNTFVATSHHLSNVIIELNSADTAQATSYVYAWHKYYAKPEIGFLWGQYSHSLRRVDDEWKISSLTLRAVATENFHRGTMHPVFRAT